MYFHENERYENERIEDFMKIVLQSCGECKKYHEKSYTAFY